MYQSHYAGNMEYNPNNTVNRRTHNTQLTLTDTVMVDVSDFFRVTTPNQRSLIIHIFGDWTSYFDIVINSAAIWSTPSPLCESPDIEYIDKLSHQQSSGLVEIGMQWFNESTLVGYLKNRYVNLDRIIDAKINCDVKHREVMLLTYQHRWFI